MTELIGKKVLITTSNWFYGKDGNQYRAVHGTLKGVIEAKNVVGFVPNRGHANWYVEIGGMTIMGCQVLYIVACDTVNTGKVKEWSLDKTDNTIKEYERPTCIYIES